MGRTLPEIRKEIDRIDDQIVDLLAQRFSVVDDVVAFKKANNLHAILPDRIQEVLNRNVARAIDRNVDPDLIMALYRLIINHLCELESAQFAEDPKFQNLA